jgi:hypothetical protein
MKTIKAKRYACNLLLSLTLAVSAHAATIAIQSGSANPTTNGFVVPPGYTGGTGGAVTNDLGLGISAWNIQGVWCCTGYEYTMTTADQAALAANNWVMTVTMRDLSTSNANTGYGPNSYGGGVSVGFDGLRYGIELHTDGQGDQVLAADPFIAGETYTIAGLGTNYVTIQLAYDAATQTADYYVNGTQVLSGISGFSNYYAPWFSFSGQDMNFSLVELQSNTSITSPNITPEPTTYTLFGIGAILVGVISRISASKQTESALTDKSSVSSQTPNLS